MKRSNVDTGGLKGIRILLAEDNFLNQEIANELLTRLGAEVKIAGNGQEAIEAVTHAEFDVLLMDIQMPVMGGYEASRLIRENPKNKDVPIIAMTAHAMQGVKEECLEAGMNDYIGKPIHPDNLVQTIRQWVNPSAPARPEFAKPSDTQSTGRESELVAAAVPFKIDYNTGITRFMGDEPFYQKMLRGLAQNYRATPQEIARALRENNRDEAVRLAHSLKGVAGNVSVLSIEHLAKDLENAAANNELESTDILLRELDKAFATLTEFIDKHLVGGESESQAQPQTFNLSKIRPIVERMAEYIWEDNIEAKPTMTELKRYMGTKMFAKEVADLEACIEEFDFQASKTIIKKLAKKVGVILKQS